MTTNRILSLSSLSIKLVSVLCIVFASSVIIGQNPFELKGRVTSASPINTADSVMSTTNKSQFDSLSDTSTITPINAESNFNSLKEKNPFEVNHVPIRVKSTPKIGNIELEIKPKISNSFIFWVMLFSWALLALVLANRREIVSKLIKSTFNQNILKLTKREEGERLSLHFFIMYSVFFINLSVFIYLIIKHYSVINSIKIWFYLLMAVTLVYITRHITLRFIGWLFPIEKEMSLFSFMIMLLNLLGGLLLIPFNLAMAFGSEVLFTPALIGAGIILGLLLLIRYTRGFFITANMISSNVLLFFIYLCAVEIMPILVGYRLISTFS